MYLLLDNNTLFLESSLIHSYAHTQVADEEIKYLAFLYTLQKSIGWIYDEWIYINRCTGSIGKINKIFKSNNLFLIKIK